MAKIQKLSDSLINKIAAGEVVERPSSVVRELVENALDAGATEVQVTVEEGGKALLQIRDNGSGMGAEDALLSLERHATSKIHNEEDLQSIHTLGFRGEALSAISSVSKFTLTTRRAEDALATRVVCVGGVVQSNELCAAPYGTTIEVHNLFFNTPARKKFLKTDRTEEDRIKQWLIASSFANPQVRYQFRVGAKEVLLLPAESSLHARAAKVFFDPAVDVFYDAGDYCVTGRVAHPAQSRGNAQALFLLVNGRVVSDRTVLRAVRDGFLGMLKDREYPVGVVSLKVNPQLVDVNVHPQKSEVRFVEPQKIFSTVRSAIGKALGELKQGMVRQEAHAAQPSFGVRETTLSSPSQGYPYPTQTAQVFNFAQPPASYESSFSSPHPLAHYRAADPVALSEGGAARDVEFVPAPSSNGAAELKVVGQLLETFIVCERGDQMVLIDFHAAHERINFNRIYHNLCARERSAQKLLLPITVEVGYEGVATWNNGGGVLREAGFDFEAFGDDVLIIREIPSWIDSSKVPKLVVEIAESLSVSGPLDGKLRSIAARLACHASVRAGDVLTTHGIQSLLHELAKAESSGACPHGRPVLVEIPKNELHKWFGRV